MAEERLPIEYYKKDKEMRDIIQSFHEMLDLRYKETSQKLKTLYQAEVASKESNKKGLSVEQCEDEQNMGSTSMLHVADVHCELDEPQCLDNTGFELGAEEVTFGSGHTLACEQIKHGIDLLFTNSKISGKNDIISNDLDKKLTKNVTITNGIAPHFCTVAWVHEPKRYQECKAIVRTVGPDKEPLTTGGADVKGVFSWSRFDKQFCKVVDNEDGTYHVMYSACSVRFHLLFITINGCDVAGSPFIVDVDDDDSWE